MKLPHPAPDRTHRLQFPFSCGTLLLITVWLIAAPGRSQAASALPPDLMPYQGYLVDGNGNPLAPNNPQNYPVTFRIYEGPTGTQGRIWSEQQVVTIDKGNFSVLLGEGTPVSGETRPPLSSVFANPTASDRYISVTITIDNQPTEILPRLRLVPSPYSFLATSAANLVQPNGTPVVTYSGDQVTVSGNLRTSGTVTANSFSGNGAALTGFTPAQIPNLDASKVVSGAFAEARIPAVLTGVRSFSGSVGIGTASPGKRLQVGDPAIPNSEGMIRLVSRSGVDGAGRTWDVGVPETDANTTGTGYSFVIDDTQRAGTEFMVQWGTGNVGIGTSSPGFPLNFPNVLGDKISLWGASGAHYGFGIQNNNLQIHTDVRASDVTFGYGSSAQMTEVMRIKGTGSVGIGTSSPAATLDVNGTVAIRGERPFHFQTFSLTGGTTLNTGWSTTRYVVSVVGFRTTNGDIEENGGSSPPISARAYQSGGTWWLSADFKSHITHEGWTLQVMRVVRDLVTDNSTFM